MAAADDVDVDHDYGSNEAPVPDDYVFLSFDVILSYAVTIAVFQLPQLSVSLSIFLSSQI